MFAVKYNHFHVIVDYQLLSSIMLSACYLCAFCDEYKHFFFFYKDKNASKH